MSTAVDTRRLTVVTHPLVQHKLSYLRDRETPTVHFRKLVEEVTLLLTYEATKDFPIEEVEIETPLEVMTAQRISGKKVAVCPVLRAGVGMLDGVLSLISSARVGFIGLYRDEETLETRDSTPSSIPTPARSTGQTATFLPEIRWAVIVSSGVSISYGSVGISFVAS